MSGFTTFNAAGFGAGGTTGNILFSYDPLYTSSVPTQNIPSGTTATSYIPGSYEFNGSNSLRVTNPQNSVNTTPFSQAKGLPITALNGSGDFTVECWYYPNNASSFTGLITASQNNASNSNAWALIYLASGNPGSIGWWYNGAYLMQTANNTAKINSWNHIAYVRSSGVGRLFVNGVLATSAADANTYRTDLTSLIMGNFPPGGAGQIGNGFLSQPRITLSAVYLGATSFVPNPNLGVLADTTFYAPAPSQTGIQDDFSPSGQLISTFTGATTYSAFAPAASSGSGMFLPDTTSGITANSAAFTFGTGPFTCEYWVNTPYTTSTAQQFLTVCNLIDFVNQPTVGSGYAFNAVSPATALVNYLPYILSPNSWNHIAFGRNSSNQLTAWINGQPVATGSNSASYTGNLNINRGSTPGSLVAFGPLRISNTAVYTYNTAFSPPTTFSNTANTVFLLQSGANLSSYLTDRSVNAIPVTIVGNTVSSINRVDYNISGNVVGDISGSGRTGLTLKKSGQGTVIPATFNNNYGGYWNFTGNTANTSIQTTGTAISSAGNVSMVSWVQTSSSNNQVVTSFENNYYPTVSATNTINTTYIDAGSGTLRFNTFTSGGVELSGTGNIKDGRWHHVTSTYNTSTGAAALYVDGQLNASGVFAGGAPFAMSGWYKIGNNSTVTNGAFLGNIGPTAVYSSVLTADQVGQIYRTQAPRFYPTAPTPGTAYYTYRNGTVQTFTVPQFVTKLNATVVGAAGAASANSAGGAGANISATLAVNPGQTLFLVVGQGGQRMATAVGNITANISQGAGGGSYVNSGAGGFAGLTGGGFTGVFTSDPATAANATVAQASAVIVAGGGGSASNYNAIGYPGGNASNLISANSRPGTVSIPATSYLQAATAITSNGTAITATLNTGTINKINYSVGEPISFVGATGIANTAVYYVSSATGSTVIATAGPNGIPGSGTVSGTPLIYGGGNPGSVQGYNNGGGGWATPSQGGWQGAMYDGGTTAGFLAPNPGSALQGGSTGYNNASAAWAMGGGGGGGWYGGGGGAAGGGVSGSGGGGSNYANSQVILANTISYGTQTVTAANGTAANGNIFLSWGTPGITANDVELNIVPNNTFSYPGTGNTVFDLSPNFNNGTLLNVTYTSPAFNFNGANSYISVADAATLEPGAGDWTMEVWFNTATVAAGARTILIKTNNGGTASDVGYIIRQNGANVSAQFGNGTLTVFDAGNIAVTINTWTHVVVTWENVAQNLVVNYKDGQRVSQTTHSFASILDTTRPLSIGSYNLNEFAQQWNGQIGIVKLYDYALNSSEVLASYNATRGIYGV
jgi:hypothetical protein